MVFVFCFAWLLVCYRPLALSKAGLRCGKTPTIMILLVILTQRLETESDPPRRQDRPEDLEAADVHVLHVVASES